MATNPFNVYVEHGHVIVEDPSDNHRVSVDDIGNAKGLRVAVMASWGKVGDGPLFE